MKSNLILKIVDKKPKDERKQTGEGVIIKGGVFLNKVIF
jgi:hypothetical protein